MLPSSGAAPHLRPNHAEADASDRQHAAELRKIVSFLENALLQAMGAACSNDLEPRGSQDFMCGECFCLNKLPESPEKG
jgi:hypothetical protein